MLSIGVAVSVSATRTSWGVRPGLSCIPSAATAAADGAAAEVPVKEYAPAWPSTSRPKKFVQPPSSEVTVGAPAMGSGSAFVLGNGSKYSVMGPVPLKRSSSVGVAASAATMLSPLGVPACP